MIDKINPKTVSASSEFEEARSEDAISQLGKVSRNDSSADRVPITPSAKPEFAPPKPHKNRKALRIKFLAAALLLLASSLAGFFGGLLSTNRSDSDGLVSSQQQRIISTENELTSSIIDTVGPSTVSIDVTGERETNSRFYGSGTTQSRSAGTGIILTANGIVVTNRHVVPEGTTDVGITLADGTVLDDVEVVGRTRDTDSLDIAFLRITDTKGKKLTPAKIGDSSKVAVGNRVVAIGNALGQFQNTVTSGIISGYGRNVQASSGNGGPGDNSSSVETLQDLFQTDAAINQGNSGGPLVNSAGEVIGVNTAVAGGDAQGIGFAIPVNNISGLIRSVIETGDFKQPYLGVRYVPLTNDVAQEFSLSVNRGAYILPDDKVGEASVIPDSPAAKAGLRSGDVILQINNTKIDETHSLTALLQRNRVDDTVTLKIQRNGREQDIKVRLEAAPK